MTYSIIQPPFTLRFREMSKAELTKYAQWFHGILAARIASLTELVRSSGRFATWEPTRSPGSLRGLAEWMSEQGEVRSTTREEKTDFLLKRVLPLDAPEKELTNRAFSIAFDVGMYFGTVAAANLPGARWEQVLKPKNAADYGQPVVGGFSKVPLNPIRIAYNTMYSVADGQAADLVQTYDVWAKLVENH